MLERHNGSLKRVLLIYHEMNHLTLNKINHEIWRSFPLYVIGGASHIMKNNQVKAYVIDEVHLNLQPPQNWYSFTCDLSKIQRLYQRDTSFLES